MFATLISMALLAGQEPPIPKIEPSKELLEMGFLVGRWTGEGEFMGTKYTDEYVYTWNNEHKTFLKATYKMSVGGQVMWTDETVVGWDADMKKIVGFTFGMDGTIGRGVAVEIKKNEWVIEGKSAGPSPFKEWRMTLTKVDDNTINTSMAMKMGDKWETAMKSTHKRALNKK